MFANYNCFRVSPKEKARVNDVQFFEDVLFGGEVHDDVVAFGSKDVDLSWSCGNEVSGESFTDEI